MIPTLLLVTAALAVRSLLVVRLEHWSLGAPVVMLLAGAVAAFVLPDGSIGPVLNTQVAQHVAEILLAILLFVDATAVRGGRLWGSAPGSVARLLLLALPLGLLAAVALGWVLLPGFGWPALLVLACVVVPIDLAPAEDLIRNPAIPVRVRSAINVESGYNDGIVSPVFLFALILAGGSDSVDSPMAALGTAVPFALKALGVGLVLGVATAAAVDLARARGWTTEASRRLLVLVVPLLTYSVAVAASGNGFVASFVAGIAFRYVVDRLAARHPSADAAGTAEPAHGLPDEDSRLLADVTGLMAMLMWFVVGLFVVVLLDSGIGWREVLFAVAALTVLRVGPVLLAFLRSDLPVRERLMLGLLGPRGTTSVVFGLLAYNTLPTGDVADLALTVTVLCVLFSAVVHGPGARFLIAPLQARPATAHGLGAAPSR